MQVCLIKAQVKSGVGVRCDRWRTDRSVTIATFYLTYLIFLLVIQAFFSEL